MYVARILYPVKVLGPGKRVGIWFDGCKHNCKGCSNPELHGFKDEYLVSLESIKKLINSIWSNNEIDGFTITGGDPFEQPQALFELIDFLTDISTDILVYTGYEYEQLKVNYGDVLKKIAVLIDGKYIEEKNEGEALRGSTNQNIIVLNERYCDLYVSYIKANQCEIQNFYINNAVISVGIHRPGYEKEIDARLKEKGLVENE